MGRNNVNEKELEQIKRKWRLQQQRMKSHQRRKEILVKEYEIQRKHRLKRSTGSMNFFKGPEATKIDKTELRKIKVDVHRNIPGTSAVEEIQRDIVNPEDIMVKRRAGEGARPIFEREELKKSVNNTEEIAERRAVGPMKDANLENKSQTSKRRRSASLSMTRNRSHSHRPTSSHHSSNRSYSRDRSRNREDRQRTQSCHVREEKRLTERRSRRDRSRSKERDQAKLDRDSRHSQSIRDRSREERMPPQHIPIPIYLGDFPPRPGMFGPLLPFAGHVPFGGSRFPMWPIGPFGPRFPPRIDMYRLRPPRNPRGFGPPY